MIRKTLLIGFLVFGFKPTAHAVWPFDQEADRMVRVVYSTSALLATTSTSTILIDLSSTTVFPHKNTREINISSIRIDVDKAAASTGTIRMGVINMVNTSSASITWFAEKSFANNVSNGDNDGFLSLPGNQIRTRVEGGTAESDGTTPYLLSTDKTSKTTAYQTDLNMTSVGGSYVKPGRGDIILEWNKTSLGAAVITVEVDYNAPPTQ